MCIKLQILESTFGTLYGATVSHYLSLSFSPMVSTWSDLRYKTPFEGSNPLAIVMPDINTLQQLQNLIAEMEQPHEEELRRLKADHDQFETHFRCPQVDEHSTHTFSECTQEESHPWSIVNTQDDPSLSHMHRPTGQAIHRCPFVDHIMEVGIP